MTESIIKYSKVKFSGVFSGSGQLPPYRAISLRGGFGHHLKRTVCTTHQKSCDGCMLKKACSYSYIFDGYKADDCNFMQLYDNIPQPFILETDYKQNSIIKPGDPLDFSMVLLGKTYEFFPYMAFALMEMGKDGLGKDRIPFTINRISSEADDLYDSKNNQISRPRQQPIELVNIEVGLTDIEVDFITPVRIRRAGSDAKTINFRDLILATLRRLEILCYFYGESQATDKLKQLAENCPNSEAIESSLEAVTINRFSGRQNRKMQLKGLKGKLQFKAIENRFITLLRMAEILHTGKSTSFGFGKIAVKCLDRNNLNDKRIL